MNAECGLVVLFAAVDLYPSMVFFHYALCQMQAYACPFSGVFGLIELVEDFVRFFRADVRTGICHLEQDFSVGLVYGNRDAPVFVYVFESV